MKKIFLFLIVISINLASYSQDKARTSELDAIFKIQRVLNYINYFYVDSESNAKLAEDAIVGILQHLDPHSIYIPKKEVEAMNEPLQGNFEGIGIQFAIVEDTVQVVAVISGGPSEKVGLMPGDRIVKVDGKDFAGIGITNSDVVKTLRGKKGTKVKLLVKRPGEKKLLDFVIVRDKIPIFSLDAAYMVSPGIAYIKLNRFAIQTDKEFRTALDSLKKHNKVKALILDLRGNGGGYLNVAIDLADEFLDDGKLVVYTKGRAVPKTDYNATDRGEFEKSPVVVLVDEGSASASEIVTGAIQDWDRGVVIGRRTFGKGLVQRQFPLQDSSMIRLTIAKYYTPSGRCIQKPYNEGVKKYAMDIIDRYNRGELTSKDSIHFPDSLKYYTRVNKRVVYGGGGIMPDIFVPLDTTKKYSDAFAKILRKGLLNAYIAKYIDENRKDLEAKYPDFDTYLKNFNVDTILLSDLYNYAKNNKVKFKEKDKKGFMNDTIAAKTIKALIARDMWHTTQYFMIINKNDDVIKKAIEVLNNKKRYENILKGNKH